MTLGRVNSSGHTFAPHFVTFFCMIAHEVHPKSPGLPLTAWGNARQSGNLTAHRRVFTTGGRENHHSRVLSSDLRFHSLENLAFTQNLVFVELHNLNVACRK